jgi:two-component system, NtrC family, sensor histidine kinase HydH
MQRVFAWAARWGLLILTFALGGALVALAANNYADAEVAGQRFAERHGILLFRKLGLDFFGSEAALRAGFENALGKGEVTFLGFWNGGRSRLAAGTTAFPGQAPTPGELQVVPSRARMSFTPALLTQRSPAALALEPIVVMEFDPVGTMDFARRARWSLWLSWGVAVLLLTASGAVWTLGERARRMQAAVEQQRHLAAVGSLAAVLAHEIRNPLASLKGHAQLLAEAPRGPRVGAHVSFIAAAVERLETVIRELLAFARSGTITRRVCSPGEVLELAVNATRPADIELRTSGLPDTWVLDPSRMQLTLVNLLENALQVTPRGGRVQASARVSGSTLVYTIADQGPGVPHAERGPIFDPFHTTRLRGTGLGLTIARRIVELHGGKIEIADAPGGGAVFSVRIPQT